MHAVRRIAVIGSQTPIVTSATCLWGAAAVQRVRGYGPAAVRSDVRFEGYRTRVVDPVPTFVFTAPVDAGDGDVAVSINACSSEATFSEAFHPKLAAEQRFEHGIDLSSRQR